MSESELQRRLRAQAIAVLSGVPGRRADMDETEFLLIRNALNEGVTWEKIAECLGLPSADAARERLEYLRGRV